MRTLIATHVSADFDGAAAVYACSKLYPGSDLVLPGSPNRNVREFLTLHGDIFIFKEEAEINTRNYDQVIIVDTSEVGRLGRVTSVATNEGIRRIVFDHHPFTGSESFFHEIYIENLGAITTLLTEKIASENLKLSAAEATFLALGIHEDTGSLTFKNTTVRDAKALSYLYENGARPEIITQFLHSMLSFEQHELFRELLDNASEYEIGPYRIILTYSQVDQYIDGASVVAHRIVELENCDFLMVVLESKDRSYIILRSRTNDIDCLEVAREFEVGGHPQAATAVVKNVSVKEICEKILKNIEKVRKKSITASDIMSATVKLISSHETISKASELMKRYGHSGLPVVEKGKVVGIITRKDIDKAISHHLSHAPVKGFMSRNLTFVEADEKVEKLMKLMTEKGIGRLPVFKEGKLVGIVTRTDLLKALHGSSYYLKETPYDKSEIIRRLKLLLGEKLFEIIKLIGYIADELGYKAYLVGGIIRDLIFGFENPDIDIVCVGNSIEVAKRLVKAVGGRYDAYERFKTCVVILPDGTRIDFASARREYYEKPGALPEVEASGLEEDLKRRDFSINALALSISRKDFGEIVDVVSGLKDLEQGKIRVLHNLSFIEDPTRIIRAVRFEKRFNFNMDKTTESLAYEAISMGVLRKTLGVRMRDEIIDALNEERVIEILDRLKELGVLKSLSKNLKYGAKTRSRIRSFLRSYEKATSWGIKVSQAYGVLAILMFPLSKREIEYFMNELKFKKEHINFTLSAKKLKKEIGRISKLNVTDHYFELKNYDDRVCFLIWAITQGNTKERKVLENYLSNLRHMRLSISGDEIIKMGIPPSKEVGILKNEILRAKIAGKVKTREEELELLKKLILERSG